MVFQAEHQHLYDISPMVWFIHVREVGDPLRLARDVHAVISATSTPLLQEPPAHPTTPLPAKRLGQILGGPAHRRRKRRGDRRRPARPRCGARWHSCRPDLNIANNIQFEPLGNGKAAAVPDFALTAGEVNPVVRTMRGFGWEIR